MLVAGCDEVGWGCGAGPIVSVIAVLSDKDLALLPEGVTDSKKLTWKRRESMFLQLVAACTDIGLGASAPWEIDKFGPKWALHASYNRALKELHVIPDLLIMDGSEHMNRLKAFTGNQIVVEKGDLKHIQVSVASIIAKVIRDESMIDIAKKRKASGLPDYNWGSNMGYLTADHVAEITKHGLLLGPTSENYFHRRIYCRKLLGRVPVVK